MNRAGTRRARGRPDPARGRRLLLDGVRRLGGAAELLRRPRHPRRRPPQGGHRPRRAAGRRRPALPRTATSASRSSLDGWQLETLPGPRPAGPAAAPAARRRRRAGAGHGRHARRPRAQRAGLAGRSRPGAAAAARLRHRGERRRPARRHRPALRRRPATTGSARRSSLGIGGVRAVRAFCARHRPPRARGLPHQRGTRGLPRAWSASASCRTPRARPSTRRSRSSGPARCSPRTPRCPRASTGSRSTWSRHYFADGRRRAAPGRPDRPGARARRRGYRRPEHVQHGAYGHAAGPARQRRLELHGEVSRGHVRRPVARLRHRARCRSASVTNGVHAPTWVAREVDRAARRAQHPAGAPHEAPALGAVATPAWDLRTRLLRGRLVEERPAPAARGRGCSAARPCRS